MGAKFWSLSLLGCALAASLAANLLLARALRMRYEIQLQQQLWPTGPPQAPLVLNPDGDVGRAKNVPTVMLLGDSRIAQWELPASGGRFRLVNAGAGGLTTAQVRLGAPELLEKFRPDAVVLEAGINDLKFLGLRPELASSLVGQAADNLAGIAAQCRARSVKLLLLEVWPATRPDLLRRFVWSAAISPAVDQLNGRLRALASPERGIRVINLFQEAGLKFQPALYRDTLHFTPEAYRRLTPVLENELEKMLPLPRRHDSLRAPATGGCHVRWLER